MVSLADESNSSNGRIILWITFGLMAGSAIGFVALGAMKPWRFRSHAVLSTGICSVAGAAYYALAINRGYTPILVGNGDGGVTRDVFYARYIDWTFTTPLLLLDVLLIAGVPLGTTLWILFCDLMMIELGLFGAITVGKFKWGWYGIACGFQLLITYGLLVSGVKYVRRRNPLLTKYYIGFSAYLAILWFGYPIVWGLAEGSNVITSAAEAGSYSGLDIASKVIFGWMIMLSLGPLHKFQAEEEANAISYVNPLETPVNDSWGNVTAYQTNAINRKTRTAAVDGAATTQAQPNIAQAETRV